MPRLRPIPFSTLLGRSDKSKDDSKNIKGQIYISGLVSISLVIFHGKSAVKLEITNHTFHLEPRGKL